MRYFNNVSEFVAQKTVFCGIDMHLKHWNVCVLCDGEVVEEVRIDGSIIRLLNLLKLYSTARHVRIVYEAGFCGFWVCRQLNAQGYSCMITPPSLLPQPYNKVKTNRRDAKTLAGYLAAGLLKAVYVPPPEVEADRRVVRRRGQVAKNMTRTRNQIKSFLHLHGLKAPEEAGCKWSHDYITWLKQLQWEHHSDAFTLQNLLVSYEHQREELAQVTRQLRQLSREARYAEDFKRLTAARGVGLITAMTSLLEIFDFGRFRRAEQFASYLGLTPAQYSSGEKVRLGHITRQGNAHLRAVLVESAWTVIRHDPHLREKYDRIRQRGVNGKKAIVAVARSLAIRLRCCLLNKQEYVIGVCWNLISSSDDLWLLWDDRDLRVNNMP